MFVCHHSTFVVYLRLYYQPCLVHIAACQMNRRIDIRDFAIYAVLTDTKQWEFLAYHQSFVKFRRWFDVEPTWTRVIIGVKWFSILQKIEETTLCFWTRPLRSESAQILVEHAATVAICKDKVVRLTWAYSQTNFFIRRWSTSRQLSIGSSQSLPTGDYFISWFWRKLRNNFLLTMICFHIARQLNFLHDASKQHPYPWSVIVGDSLLYL